MSNFEDNPFGEPDVGDPFADPSIQRVAANSTTNQRGLEDYNPFEAQQQVRPTPFGAAAPAVVPTNQSSNILPSGQITSSAGASDPAAVTQISTAELQRRQEELERKAAELERREQELRNSTSQARPNNWPPIPAQCCGLQPCFYHDITLDIPSEFQKIVTNLYRLWIFYAMIMVANIFGGLVVMLNSGTFTTFGLSIFYSLILVPSSFLCWYRPAYKAFQKDSSFNFMVFFFVFFFQMVMTVVQTIGLPSGGFCGFIIALMQFNGTVGGVFAGIFLLIIAGSFAAAAAANLLMLSKIHAIYRSTGASMAKASAEFQTEFWRNQTVQNAAADAVSGAFNNNRQRY